MLSDLDGTLVDSAYQHVLAWHETFSDFRMDIPNWKIHRRIGMSGSFFLPNLLREIGKSCQLDKRPQPAKTSRKPPPPPEKNALSRTFQNPCAPR
jgi:beta-phosphoglucomutase-like phosphatase (HAD superfamily)